MSKKIISMAVCIIMVAAILAACSSGNAPASGDDGDTSAPTTEAPAATGDVVDISFFHWKSEEAATWEKIIAMFEAENPDIRVQMEVMGADPYYTSLQARVTAGDSLDVFMVNPGSRFNTFRS